MDSTSHLLFIVIFSSFSLGERCIIWESLQHLFFLYYLKDMIHVDNPDRTLSILAVVGLFGSMLTAYPAGKMSDSLNNGRKIYIYVSCGIMALSMTMFSGCETLKNVYILMCIIGLAQGCYQTMDYSIALDTLPDPKQAARYMGIWGVAAFVGSSLGPMIGGPLLWSNRTDIDGQYSRFGYTVIWCLGAFYMVLSAFVLTFLKAVK